MFSTHQPHHPTVGAGLGRFCAFIRPHSPVQFDKGAGMLKIALNRLYRAFLNVAVKIFDPIVNVLLEVSCLMA